MKIADFVVAMGLLGACASPAGEGATTAPPTLPTASGLDTSVPPAPSTSASASAAAPAPPTASPSPAASEPPAELTEEQRLMVNEGCKLRKNTNRISHCFPERNAVGAWKPTKAEIAPALKLGAGLCYCAAPIEKAALTCMDSAKTPLVRVVIGTLDDPTDCGVSITTAELGGRRFVRMLADDRDLATFYQVEVVAELTASGPIAYYEGFEPLTDAMVQAGEQGTSEKLRAEWSTLPAEMKRWLTTRP